MPSASPVTPAKRTPLERLFQPQSIALVGATERSMWSIAANANLKRFGFAGRVHMVNPKGGVIFGQDAFTDCASIGEPVDAALLMVPESAMTGVIDDLHKAGVGGAVIISAGFAETGAEGAARQRVVADAAAAAGIRLLGPNCLGFANYLNQTAIWGTPLRRPLGDPRIALVSQSGALAAQLEQFAYQQRVGMTHMISTGNEADVTVAESIDYLAQQEAPRAIALFLESVRDPRGFEAAVRKANQAGKSVVVLKVGSSEASARAAQAHTGSLVGNDRVFDAVCRRLGVARVHSLEELIVTADLLARLGQVEKPGLGLVAVSGGMCEIATDQVESEGVEIPALAAQTINRLREALPPMATPNNPLDVTGAAMLQPDLVASAITAMAQDDAVGMLAFVFDAPAKEDATGFARRFIAQVGEGFKASGKPCVMCSYTLSVVSGEARSLTDELGVPYSGGGVRHVLNALGHLTRRSKALHISMEPALPEAGSARPRSEREVLDHLASFQVPVIPASIARTRNEAVLAAHALNSKVVLKILSPDIQHKTEVGGCRTESAWR